MERSRIGRARSAVSRTAKRVGGTALRFKFTLLGAAVGFALAWWQYAWLLRAWLPDLKQRFGGSLGLRFGGARPELV